MKPVRPAPAGGDAPYLASVVAAALAAAPQINASAVYGLGLANGAFEARRPLPPPPVRAGWVCRARGSAATQPNPAACARRGRGRCCRSCATRRACMRASSRTLGARLGGGRTSHRPPPD